MNARGFDVYSSGFARLNPDQAGTGYKEPDTMTVTHYDGMVKGMLSIVDAKHFDSVMRNALALLGTGPDWITIQAMNPNLSRYQVDFVVDTINYIATGKRKYLPVTWRELSADANNNGAVKPIVLGGRAVNPDIRVPQEWLRAHPAEIISRWISHEGGLVDLIESLHMMFGGDIEVGETGSLVS